MTIDYSTMGILGYSPTRLVVHKIMFSGSLKFSKKIVIVSLMYDLTFTGIGLRLKSKNAEIFCIICCIKTRVRDSGPNGSIMYFRQEIKSAEFGLLNIEIL